MKTAGSALGGIRIITAVFMALACLAMISCRTQQDLNDFTAEEIALIQAADDSSASAEQGTDFGRRRTDGHVTGDNSVDTGLGADDVERRTDYSIPPKGTMRVLTITDRADSLLLRDTSRNFSAKALLSEEYSTLCSLMVATVTHPSQDGVGIAGPQVGLRRRVVVVQRFDKEGEPFEVYPNIRIVWRSDSSAYGPEGCLSVPDLRGEVLRSQKIIIEYADLEALKAMNSNTADKGCRISANRRGKLRGMESRDLEPRDSSSPEDSTISRNRRKSRGMELGWEIPVVRDTVRGFTAVIFQHETDHLDGILYIDRIRS